jgi:tRNA-2-methylthio-N6-dimethylallyladenosine synthase
MDRIRYTTSHPRDMGDDLIEAHRDIEVLMPYLHLPVQSGSDRILDAMNRQHTRDDYFRLVDRVRAVRSDLALSSDFIVGFPGETDKDFADTMALVRQVGYASHFAFKYSPRPGTPAASQKQIAEEVKAQRLDALQTLLLSQQREFNHSCVGRVMDVLFEKTGRQDGQAIGRSPFLQPVHADNAAQFLGQIHRVKVDAVFPNSLKASLISASSHAHESMAAL